MSSRFLPIAVLALAVGVPGCHAAPPVPVAAAAPVMPAPRPADPAAMRLGNVYAGALPRPAPAPVPMPQLRYPVLREVGEPWAGAAMPARQGWNEVVRYVAARAGQGGGTSVLLMRGSTLAAPRWIACADKPQAVLVDLEAVVGDGRPVPGAVGAALGAIETIGVTLVYATARTGPELPPALAALARAGLRPPVAEQTLLPVVPGRESLARAAAGLRFCVIAVAGDRADDFPGGAAVRHDGWFLVPGAPG